MKANIPIALLSFPRSGNHLCRFIIEFLSAKPTAGCTGNPDDKFICLNNFQSDQNPLNFVDTTEPPICLKVHSVEELSRNEAILSQDFSLIFILRDPIEAILNHSAGECGNFGRYVQWMVKNIEFFLGFNRTKLLINYQALLESPLSCIDQVATFLEISSGETRLAELKQNHIKLFELNRTASNRAWKQPSSGENPSYHRSMASPDAVSNLRQLIEDAGVPRFLSLLGESSDLNEIKKQSSFSNA